MDHDLFTDIGPVILATFVLAFVAVVLMRLRRRPILVDRLILEEQARAAFDAQPKCVCGELATHPAPKLRRGRGSWLRKLFAAPPSYRREDDPLGTPVFCASHAHVADSHMDRFVYSIRQEYAQLNAKIATDAAGFEQEALLKCVADSLTDAQKRATRRSPLATVRQIPAKTGTEDEGGA